MHNNNSQTTLKLNKVSYSYGELRVLNELDLVIKGGELVVILGPSGCGKTTLLNLISGHVDPTSGSISKKGIARTMYQDGSLFPWLTVKENIMIGLRSVTSQHQREEELKELMQLIHLAGFEDHYPHQLSHGMKQRVQLARVIAGHSDILLMDEPFSALDYLTRLRMRYDLVRLLKNRPRTVVFVTHDIEEAAQLADRILILTDRPAKIVRHISVDLDRPRDQTDPIVVDLVKTLFEALGIRQTEKSVV